MNNLTKKRHICAECGRRIWSAKNRIHVPSATLRGFGLRHSRIDTPVDLRPRHVVCP